MSAPFAVPPARPPCIPGEDPWQHSKFRQDNRTFSVLTLSSLKYKNTDLLLCDSRQRIVMKRDTAPAHCVLTGAASRAWNLSEDVLLGIRGQRNVLSVLVKSSPWLIILHQVTQRAVQTCLLSEISRRIYISSLIIWMFAFSSWQTFPIGYSEWWTLKFLPSLEKWFTVN